MAILLARAGVVGRSEEMSAVDRFLTGNAGRSLFFEGEPGVGKSTVLHAAIERAQELGFDVRTARPAMVETALSFAGLRDLLAGVPFSTRERLPEIQRHALAVALAEEEAGSAPIDSGILGVATRGLLAFLAANGGLLLAIDDLQWLDESTAIVLVYALRRAGDADIRVLATRRGRSTDALPFGIEGALDEESLERLDLGPLSEGATRRMIRVRLGLELTRAELHALYNVTGGNPFYSLELARSGVELDESGSLHLPRSLDDVASARLELLSGKAKEALLFVAALADPRQDVLERLGVIQEVQLGVDAGVLEVEGDSFRFAHPLMRAAAWLGASRERRRAVHRRLAAAVPDLEQRARHLAAATQPPSATVADLLEVAGTNAYLRGAPTAAAELLDRALELAPTGDSDRWGRLAVCAAEAHARASRWDSVSVLVQQAQERLAAGPERAAILVAAAEMRPGLEELLRQAVNEAGETAAGIRARIGLSEQAAFAGRWQDAIDQANEAAAVARVSADRSLLGVALGWLGGMKHLDTRLDGWRELDEALAIQQELGCFPTSAFDSSQTWRACALSWADDFEGAGELLERSLAVASERGDDMSAFQLMQLLILVELRAGRWSAARSTGQEAAELIELLGYEFGHAVLLSGLSRIAGYEGNLEEARVLATQSFDALTTFGDRLWSTFALGSLVFTELCMGNVAGAIAHADAIGERFPDGRESWWTYHQGDEIEACALAGELERALCRIAAVRRAGTALELPRFQTWAERGEGLVRVAEGDLPGATRALESALRLHERYRSPFERARTLLAYGHVLRRSKRRHDARAVLVEALEAFERLGARHFAQGVRDEMRHVGGRPPAGAHELTGAEDRIARLVADGRSNKQVAAELFVTVSTVEAALTRVYRKLGIASRSQLRDALAPSDRVRLSAQ